MGRSSIVDEKIRNSIDNEFEKQFLFESPAVYGKKGLVLNL